MDPTRASSREGAFCGGVLGAAAAWEMLALNLRTINFVSGTFLALTWIAGGALAGAVVGVLGGRAFAAVRLRADDGAAFLATITVGHLLLPLGAGPVIAVVTLATRPLRRRLLARRGRLDQFVLLALAFHVADDATAPVTSIPPDLARGVPLAASTPAPASQAVSLTVHPPSPFPEFAALHARLRPLASEPLGRRAALWTGRLPMRTGAGPDVPRLLPGGGGFAQAPDRRGTHALAALFPRAKSLEGPFAPVGTLEDLALASGIPILRTPPAPGDPPLFLRVLETNAAPSAALAQQLASEGVWLDVTLTPAGVDQLALAGKGVAASPAATEVTLLDVAPTALHILGLAVPRDCDGRVLLEWLAVPGPGGRAPRYRTLAPAGSGKEEAAPAPLAVSDSTTSR